MATLRTSSRPHEGPVHDAGAEPRPTLRFFARGSTAASRRVPSRPGALEITDVAPTYSHMVTDPALIGCWRHNAEALGRSVSCRGCRNPPPMFSTDMAKFRWPVPRSTRWSASRLRGREPPARVRRRMRRPAAAKAVLDGAISMAWTAIDAATQSELREHLLSPTGA